MADHAATPIREYKDEEAAEDAEAALLPSRQNSRPRAESLGGFSLERARVLAIPFSSDDAEARPPRKLSVWDGIALTVGGMVGSGIFASPGIVLASVHASGTALLVWVGAGALALTGAASVAELGAAIPVNGGPQAYLQYSFGELCGYLYSWTDITVLQPGSGSMIALISSEYLCRVFYHTAFEASPTESAQSIPQVVIKLVAFVILAAVALLNVISNRVGTRTQVVLTSCKLLALVAMLIMGCVQVAKGEASDALKGNTFEGSSNSPGNYALALFSGLFAFSGWERANMVAAELKNTARDLPRVIFTSLLTVLVVYILANISYLLVLPKELVSHSNTVALDFGREVLGPVGGLLLALVVAVSSFGSLHGSFFTGARLVAVCAQAGFLPKFFANVHTTRQTPVNAVLLQGGLTALMILFGNFKSLLIFSSVCAWFFLFLTVSSLLVLRIKEPYLERQAFQWSTALLTQHRPFKAWLIAPIIFSTVALFLILMPIFSSPLNALSGFAFIAAGVPMYYITYHGPRFGEYVTQFKREGFRMTVFSGPKEANGYQQAADEER